MLASAASIRISGALQQMSADQFVVADGRRLVLKSLDKVLYPSTGTTKTDVLMYYSTVAPAMIPLIAQRPATRKRWPHGVADDSFFEKTLPPGAPDWIKAVSIQHTSRDKRYPLINDMSTLLWLAQLSCLEIHVPQWRLAGVSDRIEDAEVDRFVIDLDPGAPAGLAECAQVALVLREVLKAEGFVVFPVTSGSKGLQLYATSMGKSSDEQSEFVRQLGVEVHRILPKLAITNMNRAAREGRVFVDWSQNNAAKTTIAPYSLRGLEFPTVAAPRTWAEVESTNLTQLRFDEVLQRLATDGDLLADLAP